MEKRKVPNPALLKRRGKTPSDVEIKVNTQFYVEKIGENSSHVKKNGQNHTEDLALGCHPVENGHVTH